MNINVIPTLQTVTTTTTGAAIAVGLASKISLFLNRASHDAGTTTFTVEVSADGTTWVAYNKIITNVANTNSQSETRVASVALAANGTSFVTIDPSDVFKYLRVKATIATDGTGSAWVVLQTC